MKKRLKNHITKKLEYPEQKTNFTVQVPALYIELMDIYVNEKIFKNKSEMVRILFHNYVERLKNQSNITDKIKILNDYKDVIENHNYCKSLYKRYCRNERNLAPLI